MSVKVPGWGWLLAMVAALLAFWGVWAQVVGKAQRLPALEVDVYSPQAGTVQLFFMRGGVMSEGDSVRQVVSKPSEWQHYRFELPADAIEAFRLDPPDAPGPFRIRHATLVDGAGRMIREFSSAEEHARAGSLVRVEGDETVIEVVPQGADRPPQYDPGIHIPFRAPIQLEMGPRPPGTRPRALLLAGTAAVSGLLIVLALTAAVHHVYRSASFLKALDRLQRMASLDGMLDMDRPLVLFMLAVTTAGAVGVAARINGSSFSTMLGYFGEESQPALGTAKPSRTDEWGYHTPAFLYQARREDAFSVNDSMMGPGKTALFCNLPVRHVTTLCRPQFWGALFLPVEWGYAWYWQAKTWLALVGMVLLLRLFTGSSWVAIFGALWFYFSNFTQWWFSTPAGLPEMVGALAFTIVGACYLLVGMHRIKLAIVAAITAASAVNFAMCLYPPYQMPMVWAGVALFGSFAIARRADALKPVARRYRMAALGVTVAAIGVMTGIFLFDARHELQAMANTVYPGTRVVTGGGVTPVTLAMHWTGILQSEQSFPAKGANICEASGYLWFVPLLIFLLSGWKNEDVPPVVKASFIAGCIAFAGLAAWSMFPLPVWVGKPFLLHKAMGQRCLLAMGVLNIVLTCQFLAVVRRPAIERTWAQRICLFAGIMVFAWGGLWVLDEALNHWMPLRYLPWLALLIAAMVYCLVMRHRVAFALLTLGPLVLANGLVNPINVGLPGLLDSSLAKWLEHEKLPRGGWLVYAAQYCAGDFFAADGLDVFNACRYVPDFRRLRALDPQGKFQNTYNQSNYVIAEPLPAGSAPRYVRESLFVLRLAVSPTDPGLRQAGVRYLAFQTQPTPATLPEGTARLLCPTQVNGFWLYELSDKPPATTMEK